MVRGKVNSSEIKEKIPIVAIYKQNGKLHLQFNEQETNVFEVYGFLLIYLDRLRDDLCDGWNKNE